MTFFAVAIGIMMGICMAYIVKQIKKLFSLYKAKGKRIMNPFKMQCDRISKIDDEDVLTIEI